MLRTIVTLLAVVLSAVAPPAYAQQPPASAAGMIRGTLVDANGQALVGYRLRIIGADGKVHESEPTGPDGRYEIKELPPGVYSYEILDAAGNTVPVRIPPVRIEAGMSVTQPIAIVPRRGSSKKPALAWALGGAAVVAAAAIIASNDDDEKDEDPPMSASSPTN